MKIKELLEEGKKNLIGKEEPARLARMLLAYLLKVNQQYLLVNDNQEVEDTIVKIFQKEIQAIQQGTPIQYITHYQEFMGLAFYVDENVLIPQPDTEVLVEEGIELCKNKTKIQILDLCTGSGAIGISLAQKIPNGLVKMADISEKALEIAQKNAKENGVIEKCQFVQSNLFEKIEGKFDMIVSNPPYIPTGVISTLSSEVQNEPPLALDGGKDGLKFYRIIAQKAYLYLKSNGILALEIGYDQKESVTKLLQQTGNYTEIYAKKDLAGNDRIISCKKRSFIKRRRKNVLCQ